MMALQQQKHYHLSLNILLLLLLNIGVESSSWYTLAEGNSQNGIYGFRLLDSHRIRRDLSSSTTTTTPASTPNPVPNTLNKTEPTLPGITRQVSNESALSISSTTPMPSLKRQETNVGVNGSGIRKYDADQQRKVSDPIDDVNGTDAVFKETPEMIKAEHHLANLTYLNHTYYNSTFIGKPEFFKEHWLNISKMNFEVHKILSASHRRATAVTLSFDFPFYGQPLRSLTVATGGFIYTGDYKHNWLAATQYIAPLMANFDTTPTNDSLVKMADDGSQFTVVWENVTLQEDLKNPFTFAVTLRKDGDILFAYKDIPVPIQSIKDIAHPVKVGISDAYLQNRVIFYIRHNTIYEYHRVDFMNHNITSGTVLRLHALPTCLLYTDCKSCINHNTTFNCNWCSALGRCSSGIDRKKQDWALGKCNQSQISTIEQCSAVLNNTVTTTPTPVTPPSHVVDGRNSNHGVIMKHDYAPPPQAKSNAAEAANAAPRSAPPVQAHSSLSGILVGFITVAFIAFVAAWIVYAYKNPHTRSGQFLIKYRPSTWNWKRGEARYTAATIHM